MSNLNIEIRLGTWGKIRKGYAAGQFVRIENDAEATGGYLVLIKPDPEGKDGHDNWVEKYEDLPQFFAEAGWEVEWKE